MPGAYLATNLINADTALTPSSEDAAYPVENLYGLQAANVFRCTSPTTLSVLIDLGSAMAADTVAIINHNLGLSATLSLKAGSGSPPGTVVGTPVYRQHDIWKNFTITSAQYWLLEIASSQASPIEIGQLMIGNRITLPRARRIAEGYRPSQTRSLISGETYGGVLYNYLLFSRKVFNPSFRVGSAAELAVFEQLDAEVNGKLLPFVYIPDELKADCYYVRKEESFEPSEQGRISGPEPVHDYQMTLTEESRGLNITA